MTTTTGSFLKEKLSNMAQWVTVEVGKENLPVDLITGIAGRSELELTAFAAMLQTNSTTVHERDWDALQVLARPYSTFGVGEVVSAVRARPGMHDKFWRYMCLCVEVMETALSDE